MSEAEIELSPAGRQRRGQILAMALRQAARRRRRRTLFRSGVVMAGVMALLLLRLERRTPSGALPVIHRPVTVAPGAPASPVHLRKPATIVITKIQTDPQICEKLASRVDGPPVTRIDDAQLLNQLAQAHQSAGLIRLNGRPMLLFRSAARRR